jgi:Fe(3+) dicitrate transport protein
VAGQTSGPQNGAAPASRPPQAGAADPEPAQQERAAKQLVINERVMVIGDAAKIRDIPGSAHFLTLADLERQLQAFDDINRVLRQIPGINLQEEEGFGLRPNIGLRGTGSERSSKITLMEDGVLVAPAPYAAPAAYYFPTTGRMEAIEVRKGSSQVKYGPRTTGGALNLMSTGIPNDFNVRARFGGGEHGSGRGHLTIGDSGRRYGWLLETYQIVSDGFKELDGGGETGFEIQDYLVKLRLNSDPVASIYQDLEVKVGKTKQVSDETYLGLTDEDFRANPLRRYAASQEDVFRSDHEQYQLRYFAALAPSLDVTAIAYRNDFFRSWYKLQSINGTAIGNIFANTEAFALELAIARGATSNADALKVRANARDYYSQGVQAVVGWRPETGTVVNQLEIGLRYHEDQEDRFQHEDGFQMLDGTMQLTRAGAPGSQSNRISDASAWALFAQDQIDWGKWSFIPGVRLETIELVRTDFSSADPGRTAPTRVGTNDVDVVVPGIGVGYDATPELRLFGGVHRGFSPPGPGTNELTEPEKSVNYELGARFGRGSLGIELTGFFSDYSNLLGADTLASGGGGTGALFNGGQVDVIGLEAAARHDLASRLGWQIGLPIRLAYTYTHGSFQNSFQSDFEPWGDVEEGDNLPYLPEHQLSAGIGVERGDWRLGLGGSYNSAMRTDASHGPIDPARATDSFLVWDFTGEVRVGDHAVAYGGVENLTNNAYIVARRPAGVRPGLPRTVVAGLKLDF